MQISYSFFATGETENVSGTRHKRKRIQSRVTVVVGAETPGLDALTPFFQTVSAGTVCNTTQRNMQFITIPTNQGLRNQQ